MSSHGGSGHGSPQASHGGDTKEGLLADVSRFWSSEKIAGDLLLEGFEDLSKQATPHVLHAIRNKADVVRWLAGLHLPDTVVRVAGHSGGHALGSILFGMLVRGGVKPEIASHAHSVLKHAVSGATGATADEIERFRQQWSAKIGEGHASTEAAGGSSGPMQAPLVYDENRLVAHAHEAKVVGIDGTGKMIVATETFDGMQQSVPLCAQALDDRMREIERRPRRTKKPQRGRGQEGAAVESEVIHPRFVHGEYEDVMRIVRVPDCPECSAVKVARERFEGGRKDWYAKVGVEGVWLADCLRRTLTHTHKTGLKLAEAKAMMEALTTAPAAVWKIQAVRQLANRDPATTPVERLPDEIVEDLLALIDWQGHGEHSHMHKAREVLGQVLQWWRDTGSKASRRVKLLLYAYVVAILSCVFSLFVVSWLLVPQEWMVTGILTAGLGALLLTVLLYFLGPLNSVVSWATEVLPLKDRVGDEFFMTVRKLMAFFLTFGLFLISMHVVGSDHVMRILSGFVVGFLILVPIANAAPNPHLRSMLQKAVSAQTFLFLVSGTLAAVQFQMLAARDQHIIPKDYVMQVGLMDVQQGVTAEKGVVESLIVEEGVPRIPSPDGVSFFRVDELSRAFGHLAQAKGPSVACFDDRGVSVSLPDYRLKRVPAGYGCAAGWSAYLMYPTPWRTFWGPHGLEYASVEDMVETRRARERERVAPFFSRVHRETYGLTFVAFGVALLVVGLGVLFFSSTKNSYIRLGGGVAAFIGCLMIAASILAYNGKLEKGPWERAAAAAEEGAEVQDVMGTTEPMAPRTTPAYREMCAELQQRSQKDWRTAGCHHL